MTLSAAPARQSANAILMIDSQHFGYNPETGEVDNDFQQKPDSQNTIRQDARKEVAALAQALKNAKVEVISFRGQRKDAACPDEVFPNWLFTTPGGTLVICPMARESRRRERREDIIARLSETFHDMLDLSAYENEGKALEGTGSLLHDHINRRVYVALSDRTDESLARRYADGVGYAPVFFNTRHPATQKAIYHTDILGHIGTGYAAICPDVIVEPHRARVMKSLSETHEIIRLKPQQILSFAGNALEVTGSDGRRHLSLSQKAFQALDPGQREQYSKYVSSFIACPLPTLETYGGGSARCAKCEIFLPQP